MRNEAWALYSCSEGPEHDRRAPQLDAVSAHWCFPEERNAGGQSHNRENMHCRVQKE